MNGATPPSSPPQAAAAGTSAAQNAPAGVVPSERILQGHRSVAIAHNGSVYRLQATRQGKLILTK